MIKTIHITPRKTSVFQRFTSYVVEQGFGRLTHNNNSKNNSGAWTKIVLAAVNVNACSKKGKAKVAWGDKAWQQVDNLFHCPFDVSSCSFIGIISVIIVQSGNCSQSQLTWENHTHLTIFHQVSLGISWHYCSSFPVVSDSDPNGATWESQRCRPTAHFGSWPVSFSNFKAMVVISHARAILR